jgi:hypothetical protein
MPKRIEDFKDNPSYSVTDDYGTTRYNREDFIPVLASMERRETIARYAAVAKNVAKVLAGLVLGAIIVYVSWALAVGRGGFGF